MSHYLSLLLSFPTVGALTLLCVSRRNEDAIKWLANGVALGGFLCSTPLWSWYNPKNPDFQLIERARWMPSIGAEFFLGIDGISALFILLTSLIGFIAMLSSWRAITERVKEYYVALLVLQTALLGAFMSLDFLLFFFFWMLTQVPMYFLIRTWGSGDRRHAAVKFFLYMLAGSSVLLLGLLALYFHNHAITGIYTFDMTQLQKLSIPASLQRWIFLAFFVGFAVTVPIFPFHTWLPDANTDAPTAGAIILAAVTLKLGTYGFLRVSLPMLPDASRTFVPFIAALSIIGIVYGALVAFAQKDWKRLVAYVSVSQMATAMLALCALNPVAMTGSVLQQINHGIAMGALLLLIGVVCERGGSRRIADHHGLWKVMPAFAAVFLLMTFSSIGLPALNGFVGESLILQGVFKHSRMWAAFGAGGIVLSAGCMLYLYRRTMFGSLRTDRDAAMRDLGARDWATLVPLIGLAVWIGLYPKPFLDRITLPVLKVAARVDPAYEGDFAAACDTTVTPELKAASPANQFLAAAPCGPDGQPLAPSTTTSQPGAQGATR